MELLKKDFSLFDQLAESQELVLTDTSFIETVVFGARAGIEMSPGVEKWIQTKRLRDVLFLSPLEDYQSTSVRMESHDVAAQISKEVQDAYLHYGYNVVVVPPMSVEERCNFVEEHMKHNGGK